MSAVSGQVREPPFLLDSRQNSLLRYVGGNFRAGGRSSTSVEGGVLLGVGDL
jgi:hypothetical protein